jgi:CheY-like chemotaxis protein/HPt (histidine-containing phosphotransfer) domain-containing protein
VPQILVADDDEISRVIAKTMLKRLGYRTAMARNGREAVEMALSDRYAAILMDCEMPEMDGCDATGHIRAAENGERVPIIAITAYADQGRREHCLAAGMDDLLLKPVRSDQLDAVIQAWLGGAARSPTVEAVGSADGPLDQVVVAQLRGLLTKSARASLLKTFAKSFSRSLADMERAFECDDLGELRRLAHLLKGSATTVGAVRLRRACKELERAGRRGGPPLERRQLDDLRTIAVESLALLRGGLL